MDRWGRRFGDDRIILFFSVIPGEFLWAFVLAAQLMYMFRDTVEIVTILIMSSLMRCYFVHDDDNERTF